MRFQKPTGPAPFSIRGSIGGLGGLMYGACLKRLSRELTLRDGKVFYDLNGITRLDWNIFAAQLSADWRCRMECCYTRAAQTALIGQREGDDVRARGNCHILTPIHHVRHRRCVPALVRVEVPDRFAGSGVHGRKSAGIVALEY